MRIVALVPAGHAAHRPSRPHKLPLLHVSFASQKLWQSVPLQLGRQERQSSAGSYVVMHWQMCCAFGDSSHRPPFAHVSGAQLQAVPLYPSRHAHAAAPLLARHSPCPLHTRPSTSPLASSVVPGQAYSHVLAGTKANTLYPSLLHWHASPGPHVVCVTSDAFGQHRLLQSAPLYPSSHTHVGPSMHTPWPLHLIGHGLHVPLSGSQPSPWSGHEHDPSSRQTALALPHVKLGSQKMLQRAP